MAAETGHAFAVLRVFNSYVTYEMAALEHLPVADVDAHVQAFGGAPASEAQPMSDIDLGDSSLSESDF